jgi:hypothetical protein
MAETGSLEELSSAELHDLAVRRARRHLDVGFFWGLMQRLPAAEAAADSSTRPTTTSCTSAPTSTT